MNHDLEELRRVGRTLNEVLALLKGEDQRLTQQLAGQEYDLGSTAGSPRQTVIGLGEMISGVRKSLDGIASYAGFDALGLERQAAFERGRLHDEPLCVPSGTNRMARPLGEATVQALRLLRELDSFFKGDFAARIDKALAAPRATYPPTDWVAYNKAWRREMREDAETA
ncbi:hypothetical protein [Streptomyces sp. cmx-18-6]|uniref:hypothetical protein n=1 Tax=Streptomyces sp. cmx-18-6 TaxID=2790930 RepID=UPI003980A1E9